MGIHYDYKSTRGAKAMEKQAKREKKLAEKKAKRLAKEGPKEEILSPPHAPYTELLLSSIPEMDAGWLDKIIDQRKYSNNNNSENNCF